MNQSISFSYLFICLLIFFCMAFSKDINIICMHKLHASRELLKSWNITLDIVLSFRSPKGREFVENNSHSKPYGSSNGKISNKFLPSFFCSLLFMLYLSVLVKKHTHYLDTYSTPPQENIKPKINFVLDSKDLVRYMFSWDHSLQNWYIFSFHDPNSDKWFGENLKQSLK